MYARVTFSSIQAGKVDESLKILRDSILPALKKQKGFKGSLGLTNRDARKSITISLWDTQADMTAAETSGFYRDQLAKVAPLLTGAPTMEHYEVTVQG